MNNIVWNVYFVHPDSWYLIDRTGKHTVATTDVKTRSVYLSDGLHGDFLKTVILHELGHCALYSYGLLDDIHRLVHPSKWIQVEEFICNVIADHGEVIFNTLYDLYGPESWKKIPDYIEQKIRGA